MARPQTTSSTAITMRGPGSAASAVASLALAATWTPCSKPRQAAASMRSSMASKSGMRCVQLEHVGRDGVVQMQRQIGDAPRLLELL